MSWWSRLIGGRSDSELKPQRLDYLKEALALERQGDLDAALTSYRLALRDKPDDVKVLENMAIACTKMGRIDEAVRYYKRALEITPDLPGAHYGLGFLLLKRGDQEGAQEHLSSFLAGPPVGKDMQGWIDTARAALQRLQATGNPEGGIAATPEKDPPVVER